MTENDEGAVRRYRPILSSVRDASGIFRDHASAISSEVGEYVLHEDHERIVTALRARLAAAEARASRAIEHGTEMESRYYTEPAKVALVTDERDQAIARLGEAEKAVVEALEELRNHSFSDDGEYNNDEVIDLIKRLEAFLARDSAGGIS
jgi:hypothetical protein